MEFIIHFPLARAVALESWSGGNAAMLAALHCTWLPHSRVTVEETAFNKFSNQNLPGSELPVQHYLVLIQKHVLWKFEASVHVIFTFFDENDFEKP